MNYENDSVSDEIINSYAGYFNKEKYEIGFGIIAGNRELLRFAVKCKETVLSPADAEALLELMPDNQYVEERALLIEYINSSSSRDLDFDFPDSLLDEGFVPLKQLVNEWHFSDRNSDNGRSLTGYIGSAENVFCPTQIEGDTVTRLSRELFKCNRNIKKVIVGEGVKVIGASAFCDCTALEYIRLPSTLKEINIYAFKNCPNLKSVAVGSIAGWCGVRMFDFSDNLHGVRHTLSVDGVPADDIVIPDGVKSVAPYVFRNCENLQSVSVPGSAEEICEYAFSECPKLKTVVLGEGVKKIGPFAFSECDALESINIPDSIESIDKTAFLCCTALDEATQKIIGSKTG